MQSVLKISEAASIALHAMTYIACNANKPASTREIAESFKISENHLSKVLQRLTKSDLLKSIKGPQGGFVLTRNSTEITFLEIYEAIDGTLKEGCCLFGRQACKSDKCIMGDFLNKINKEVKEFFESKKLSDFCKK
jgi:Rrf2 family protein